VDAWLENGSYSDGLLSFALSFYIGWQLRFQAIVQNKVNLFPLGLLLAVSTIWWLGDIANVL